MPYKGLALLVTMPPLIALFASAMNVGTSWRSRSSVQVGESAGKKAESFREAHCSLISVPLQGTACCESKLQYRSKHKGKARDITLGDHAGIIAPKRVCFLKCPRCDGVEPSSYQPFRIGDLDKKGQMQDMQASNHCCQMDMSMSAQTVFV